ncbi:uncharacterized protein SCHCODRAFT_02630491 [Schizophyllum commune H4-8]|uniref:uncharacterized protein n=1 Tax=Schizophyllum commune (strain H4-8 / FGSC 9210) TaxID=578458 RepID=UPI002160C3E4|nr:uncharacterized protein SCHCODRAFT_02630491 [Schizophyllum commune H4-8]KAI5889962.1 hypothetical protein SCHCODRAFT_02630491 [Schizophyllum commune H4-8]
MVGETLWLTAPQVLTCFCTISWAPHATPLSSTDTSSSPGGVPSTPRAGRCTCSCAIFRCTQAPWAPCLKFPLRSAFFSEGQSSLASSPGAVPPPVISTAPGPAVSAFPPIPTKPCI